MDMDLTGDQSGEPARPPFCPRNARLPDLFSGSDGRIQARMLFIESNIWQDGIMTIITLERAQQELPLLVKRALDGEEIVIEAEDKLVRLAPCQTKLGFDERTARRHGYGSMKGQFVVTDAFFEPLPEDELKLWEGRANE
jgi:antitoxin (DNA-binding transcriptional repressor) of toxin-antitoxin stability system